MKRKSYGSAFKQQVVQLIQEDGKAVSQVAWELSLHDNTVYRWAAEMKRMEDRRSPAVDNLIKKVMTTMKNLNSVWDDAAAKDFTDKVEKLKPTFDKFGDSLEELAKHMDTVSAKYKELSASVISAQKF